jgi:hypothetical protein
MQEEAKDSKDTWDREGVRNGRKAAGGAGGDAFPRRPNIIGLRHDGRLEAGVPAQVR